MFYEARFPIYVSYGASGGAGWSTRVSSSDGGYADTQALWATPRGRWTIMHELRKPAEWAELIAFHRIMRGKLHGFRFQDWTDYTATDANGVVVQDGSNMRLAKRYTVTDVASGLSRSVDRWITKPQPYTVVTSVATVIDYTTGILTGATVGLTTWSGKFDVPVRFDMDLPQMSYDFDGAEGGGVSWRGVEIVELPLAEVQ